MKLARRFSKSSRVLPEYGLTRADERLLRRHAEDIVGRLLPHRSWSPNWAAAAEKRRAGFWKRWRAASGPRTTRSKFRPTALAQCARNLGQMDCVSIVGFEQPYLDGLLAVAASRRREERLLVLFLGSTIGNFDRPAGEQFLAEVRRMLYPGRRACCSAPTWKNRCRNLLRGLRRSAGRHGRVQSESPGAHQPRAGRAISTCGLSPPGALERCGTARRNALAIRRAPDRRDSRRRRAACIFEKVKPSGRKARTSTERRKYRRWRQRNGFRSEAQWVDQEWPFAQRLLIAE